MFRKDSTRFTGFRRIIGQPGERSLEVAVFAGVGINAYLCSLCHDMVRDVLAHMQNAFTTVVSLFFVLALINSNLVALYFVVLLRLALLSTIISQRRFVAPMTLVGLTALSVLIMINRFTPNQL